MVEIKVTTATVGSLLASLGIAILNGAVADTSILGSMPAWLQWLILIIAPPLVTFLAGYAQSSSTSRVSDGFVRND